MDGVVRNGTVILSLVIACIVTACNPPAPGVGSIPMNWQPIDSLQTRLPEGVHVFGGQNDTLPLRAWYVHVEESRPDIITRVVVSDDTTDLRETVSSFAQDLDACVVVNGGYFNMSATPATHAGLLMVDNHLIAPATHIVLRDTLRFEAARAALGITENDEIQITWASTQNGTLYSWSDPPGNKPEKPASTMDYLGADVWNVHDALGAGPMLLLDNRPTITVDEEVFFGTSIPNVHPRTAAGRTEDGSIILMVVDGRQDISRGVSLEELSSMMREVGTADALNLDGGGSSTIVVAGIRLNRPTGDTFEREVMSAVATFCKI